MRDTIGGAPCQHAHRWILRTCQQQETAVDHLSGSSGGLVVGRFCGLRNVRALPSDLLAWVFAAVPSFSSSGTRFCWISSVMNLPGGGGGGGGGGWPTTEMLTV